MGNEQQIEATETVTAEFENIRVAWQWLVDNRSVPLIGQVLESLWLFFEIKNLFQEGETFFGQGVEALIQGRANASNAEASLDLEQERIYAQLLIRQGWFDTRLARFDKARPLLEEGLTIARHIGDGVEVGRALHHLGQCADVLGRFDEAEQLLRESLAALQGARHSTPFDLGSTAHLAFLLMKVGQVEEGQRVLDEAIRQYHLSGNLRAVATMSGYIGGILVQQGAYDKAKPSLHEVLTFQEKIDDWVYMRMTLAWLGEAYEGSGDDRQAKAYYERSLIVSQGNGDRAGVAIALERLSRVSLALQAYQPAQQYIYEALQTAADLQFLPVMLEALISVSILSANQGDVSKALQILRLVIHHPATDPRTKLEAEQLHTDVLKTIPTMRSLDNSAQLTLESIVADFLTSEASLPNRKADRLRGQKGGLAFGWVTKAQSK